ncbi:hypothetical protein [Tsukamurella paurometabola]|uniref:MarR family transcriptional regulator n=1 Tax=Tsukamurella paurometabola TaxID=2061 RepID=A0ABS5NII5_TSUPA|nr:hypothetical protein [Tsukamurella paurometabola]MBS4104105.1 hypothetical protein [Tsukamurella paurometabola]
MGRPKRSEYGPHAYPPNWITILAGVTYWPTPGAIAYQFGFEARYVSDVLNKLVRAELVEKKCQGVFAITELGREELAKGNS